MAEETIATSRSLELLEQAQRVIPGGVNSPVRSFHSVGGVPRFINRAEGAYLYDADGNRYIDFINSWGPMILGHGHPEVVAAIQHQASRGLSFGAPTELEVMLAEQIVSMVPGIEKVRLTSSGTEACMTSIRLARGITGRSKIIKAEGCYHGHADPFLVAAGSGLLAMRKSSSAGVTQGSVSDTIVVPFNDLEAVDAALRDCEIAAVIVEPVAGNMGCIPPSEGYLKGLRNVCTKYGTLLIFDEVMTGFRLAPGGAQELYNVLADLVTYGKVIGGGMPIGAVCGSTEYMDYLAPNGPVYQAGTLSGNPLAVVCGLTTLKRLHVRPDIYQQINEVGERTASILRNALNRSGQQGTVNQLGSMVSVYFGVDAVTDLTSAKASDTEAFNRFFHSMLRNGVMLPPSAFESWFISHSIEDRQMQDVERAVLTSLGLA
jgi:glutamate-1-semialdehyde 2,1-aminomutase